MNSHKVQLTGTQGQTQAIALFSSGVCTHAKT